MQSKSMNIGNNMNSLTAVAARWLGLLSMALLITGCGMPRIYADNGKPYSANSEVPIAGNFETSIQLKMQAAEHWKRVASDSANQLSKFLSSGAGCLPKGNCQVLVVPRPCSSAGCNPQACETEFSKAFYAEFVTALVNQGQRVASDPSVAGMKVEIELQPVLFSDNRPQYRYAGNRVELAPGVWALRDKVTVSSGGSSVGPQSGTDLNWYRSNFAAGATPPGEIVITVSAKDTDGVYRARNTNIYYFADQDSSHYICPKPVEKVKMEIIPELPAKIKVSASEWDVPVVGDCSQGRCITCSPGMICNPQTKR